jgi:hypothetical protein
MSAVVDQTRKNKSRRGNREKKTTVIAATLFIVAVASLGFASPAGTAAVTEAVCLAHESERPEFFTKRRN